MTNISLKKTKRYQIIKNYNYPLIPDTDHVDLFSNESYDNTFLLSSDITYNTNLKLNFGPHFFVSNKLSINNKTGKFAVNPTIT